MTYEYTDASQYAWEVENGWNRNTTYSERSCSNQKPYYLDGEVLSKAFD